MIQELRFEANNYRLMVAHKQGAVFSGEYDFFLVDDYPAYLFVQMFLNEHVRNTVGGAISIEGMNFFGFTIVKDCDFRNNFGKDGGSINMNEGGNLFAKGNTFELSPGFQYIKNDFVDIKRDKQILEGVEDLAEY